MSSPTTTTRPAVVDLDGTCDLGKDAIGGKAWGINRMRSLGLDVPPAFTLTTDCCTAYYEAGRTLSDDMWNQVVAGVRRLEEQLGRTFGAGDRPLLVSVRSGAAVSMPGMMDTVLNLGISDDVEAALAAETGSPTYAADTHRRFREQFRDIVLGDEAGVIPGDPWRELRAAVCAVFDSWQSPRAVAYRKHHGVEGITGTAVTVQAMVFGNLDEHSGTGVLFSRNPSTGQKEIWGEWLVGGQGEDVVSGRTTPKPLSALADLLPDVHDQLCRAARMLEVTNRDIQDIEFTVEAGKLWLLQARSAKRAPRAAVRAAVAMVEEDLITAHEALSRVTAAQLRTLLNPELSDGALGEPIAQGEPACPGLATGVAVTDPDEAEERADAGEDVILVRATTSPDDFHGMVAARAIVTEHGGSTSHAAVVSREIPRACVVGCGDGVVDLLAGREITVDGNTGKVWAGRIEGVATDESAFPELRRLSEWAGPLTPLPIYRLSDQLLPTHQDVEVVDLDDLGDKWRAAVGPMRGYRGAVLETDEGIHAAVAANAAFVIVEHRLPAMFAAIEHRAV